jgi:hypothetical protein
LVTLDVLVTLAAYLMTLVLEDVGRLLPQTWVRRQRQSSYRAHRHGVARVMLATR